MTREIFTQLVRKELPGLRRFLLAALREERLSGPEPQSEILYPDG